MNPKLFSIKPWLYLGVLLAAFVLGTTVALFSDAIIAWGHYIPQPDMGRDYIAALIWAISIGVSIFIWPIKETDKKFLFRLWFVRSLVTLVFMLFYENNYGLDAYGYFESSLRHFPVEEIGFGKGTQNMKALCWLHNQIFPVPSYHALKVTCSLIGLLGVYVSYHTAKLFFADRPVNNQKLLYILGFFPSILFWSSILGKDPMVFFGISLYLYGVVAWYQFNNFLYFIPLTLGIIIAMMIRIWLAPILLFPLVVFAWGGIRGLIPRIIFLTVAIGGFLVTLTYFTAYFGLETGQDVVSTTNQLSRSWSTGGSGQEVPELTSVGKIIAFAPLGIFTALFRPLPGEVMNPFGLLAGLENLGLLFLFWKAVTHKHKQEILKRPLVKWAIVLILTWSTIYGFISFQNLGAGVRFKLQILPIFLILLFYVNSHSKRIFLKQNH